MENLENEQKGAMDRETAINELRSFVEEHSFENLSDKKLEDKYPQVLSALISGKLILGENPTYELKEAVKSKEETVVLEKVEFKTRMTVGEKTRLSKGIDMREDALGFSYACMAHVMSLKSTAYLDKMHKYDLKVCEQLSTLFV